MYVLVVLCYVVNYVHFTVTDYFLAQLAEMNVLKSCLSVC